MRYLIIKKAFQLVALGDEVFFEYKRPALFCFRYPKFEWKTCG
jgi:hypothetical protein